jgi:hypothetical protein
MSKQDYVRFAAMFAGEMALRKADWAKSSLVRGLILSTADIFAQGNERFDRARFYVASGLDREGDLLTI